MFKVSVAPGVSAVPCALGSCIVIISRSEFVCTCRKIYVKKF